MTKNLNRNFKLFLRLNFWVFYFTSGIFLYSQNPSLTSNLIAFSKIIYPLSVFWLQVRITKREPWLPINEQMSTAQLWFKLLPIIGSLITFIITTLNFLIYLFRITTNTVF